MNELASYAISVAFHGGADVAYKLSAPLNITVYSIDTINSTDETSGIINSTDDASDESDKNWAALGLSLLIAATIVGNVMVCVAVCGEQRLHNMTNYFLMSLAIADLMVALFVMPPALIVTLYGTSFTYACNIIKHNTI